MTDRSDADRKPEETRGEGATLQPPAASPTPSPAAGPTPEPGASPARSPAPAPSSAPPPPTVPAAPGAPPARTAPGDPATPVCEVCGTPMYDRHCKIVCPNCGYLRDCSDP